MGSPTCSVRPPHDGADGRPAVGRAEQARRDRGDGRDLGWADLARTGTEPAVDGEQAWWDNEVRAVRVRGLRHSLILEVAASRIGSLREVLLRSHSGPDLRWLR